MVCALYRLCAILLGYITMAESRPRGQPRPLRNNAPRGKGAETTCE
jgi:hypothetical protein